VEVTGFVPDVRPVLWSATMCVVPLHVGGGTRLKILEALAAGCPVVSTSVGAEGLSLIDGEHLRVADSPQAFAQAIARLLESSELRRSLAARGREAVARQYDWRQVSLSLEQACLRAMGRLPRPRDGHRSLP
jgi:glycosyltransferase involved in cell wall biosynthesis